MNITTEREIMIFAKQGNYGAMYSTGISEKQQDGSYITTYIPVRFRKGIELADRSMIKITKGWLKPTKDMKIVLFVSEYEQNAMVDKVKSDESGFDGGKLYSNEVTLDDSLPF